MSFTRKIIDGARSGLNTVMERIAADDTPLSYVDEDGLRRELEHRIEARKASPDKGPRDNASARLASASTEAREKRIALARKRAQRIKAVRDKRAAAAQRAEDEAFKRAKEQAWRASSTQSTSSSSGGAWTGAGAGKSQARTGGRGFPFQRQDEKIAEYYKRLDLPYGATFAEVKASYRKLMRKFHPDRHAGNPKKQKAATNITMQITQAYNELERHLEGKK